MHKDDILIKAKYIVFPQKFQVKYATNTIDYSNNIINDKIILNDLNSENNRYFYYEGNQHHFTTEYSFNTVLPNIESLFHFEFNKEDFIKISSYKEIQCTNNKIMNYDFSYFLPKTSINYTCTFYNVNAHEFNKINLNSNELVNCSYICNFDTYSHLYGEPTNYHKLFKFPHQSCVIENQTSNNGKTLLLNCDSQMIPSIPLLCKYYYKVIVLDSRFGISTKPLYENEQINDVLFAVWIGHPINDFYKNLD